MFCWYFWQFLDQRFEFEFCIISLVFVVAVVFSFFSFLFLLNRFCYVGRDKNSCTLLIKRRIHSQNSERAHKLRAIRCRIERSERKKAEKSVDDLLWRDRKDIVCYLAFHMIDISERRRSRRYSISFVVVVVPSAFGLLCSEFPDGCRGGGSKSSMEKKWAHFCIFINTLREAHKIPWRRINGKSSQFTLGNVNVKPARNCGQKSDFFFFISSLFIIY